jgi:hypothetical protein
VFNIVYVEEPSSYWAIILPMAMATGLLSDTFKRQVKVKLDESMEPRDGADEEIASQGVTVATIRKGLGCLLLCVGLGGSVYANVSGAQQEKACKDEFGACLWSRIEPKLYFKGGLFAGGVCGFGVDQNPSEDTWRLDVSGCGLKEFGEWREEYAGLEALNLDGNELVELPGWMGEGKMGELRELRARDNKLEAFAGGMLGGGNATLELVDLRDNEIAELPYEMMDVDGVGLRLLFDGNPCAVEVDWRGLGVDRLPARMGPGYDNGAWGESLRVLKLAHNELDEGVFGELANFTNIEELDVSWNRLGGIGEEVWDLARLRELDVSGNSGVSAQ